MPRPTSLSIELLRTLVSLVHNGGDAMSTARELGINQPSMSKRLRVFQHPGRLLKQPWVERHGHVWKLTDAGQRAYPGVEEVIRRYRQLLDEPNTGVSGPVVQFACGQTTVHGPAREALRRFRKSHPHTHVRVRTPRSRQRLESLAAGGIDLAEITHDEKAARRLARRPLVLWPFTLDPLVVVAGAKVKEDWAKALAAIPEGEPVRVKALVGLGAPMLLPEPGAAPREQFDQALSASNALDKLNVILETSGWGTLVEYAREGFGVAVVSRASLVPHEAALTIRPLDPATFPPTRTWLAARRRSGSRTEPDLSSEGLAFRQALMSAAGLSG